MLQQRNEFLFRFSIDEHIVGRNTGLAGVRELTPRNAPRCRLEIGIRHDDTRAFATEFERDWCQVFRGGSHDDTADVAATRIKDVVPGKLQQRSRFSHSAFDNFYAGAVASRNGSGQAGERELQWVVPCANDQDDA